jgi:hypothetical protein
MSKILLTSGCSFSECISQHIDTWPRHLYRTLRDYGFDEHISSAMGSQGNGLISRGIIYNVVKALERYDSKDILVGIMWSGSNRYDFRCQDVDGLHFIQDKIHNGWIENPTNFVSDADKNWVILNVNWVENNIEAETYYRMFHSDIGCSIYSLEHIIRTQDFLQKNNIKYFFTDYVDENIVTKDLESHPEIEYLLKLIDKRYYLPVTSEFTWCKNNTKYSHLWPPIFFTNRWVHPTQEMHKEFVDEVIFPFLNKNILTK